MRKINKKLMCRLTDGDLLPLLNYIKSDPELRLEVRRGGEAFVYYKKGKALAIKALTVDKEYGEVPLASSAVSNPADYFRSIKKVIDKWLTRKKDRAEFDTQQAIAQSNQDIKDKYIILDMEYAFEQNQLKKEDREKQATFDLLGIERDTGILTFFELKRGMGATKGKSGIEDHILDFETCMYGKNSVFFRSNLAEDIKNIVEDKKRLGIIEDFDLTADFEEHPPKLVFIFHPNHESEVTRFSEELQGRYELIVVDSNDYKLK